MARRVYCAGTAERPCPARAWWFYEAPKGGRPVERCPICWPLHRHAVRLENKRNENWKRAQLRLAGVAA